MNWQRPLLTAGTGLLGISVILLVFILSIRESFARSFFGGGSLTTQAMILSYVGLPSAICFAGSLIAWSMGVPWLRGCIFLLVAHLVTFAIIIIPNNTFYPDPTQTLIFALVSAIVITVLLITIDSPFSGWSARFAIIAVTIVMLILNAVPTLSMPSLFLAWTLIPGIYVFIVTNSNRADY